MTSPPDRVAQLRARMQAWDVNPLGLGFLVPGTLLILLSYTALEWFRPTQFQSATFFFGVHDIIDAFYDRLAGQSFQGKPLAGYFSSAVSRPYFSWLSWVLVAASALGAVATNSRLGGGKWFVRWAAAVLSVAGGALTVLALYLVIPQGNPPFFPHFSTYLGLTSVGPWAAVLGYLMLLISCFVPRRDW